MNGETAIPLSADERRPLDDRILNIVDERGTITLDQLVTSIMPAGNWAPVFLATDRLSRSGQIRLRRMKNGEYEISGRYGYASGLSGGGYERGGSRVEWRPPHAHPAIVGA